MSNIIRIRRDTAANWTSTNPVLALGEQGLETDTRKVKYGDGSTAFNSLSYPPIGATEINDLTDAIADASSIYIGDNCGGALTTGTNNLVIGYNAAPALTTGFNNVTLGKDALTALTTGRSTVAIGRGAIPVATTAGYNTGCGDVALGGTTGAGNTGLGYGCGDSLTSGTYNCFIGYLSATSLATATNSTALGNGATISASNQIQLGNTSVTTVKVGNGTATIEAVMDGGAP